MPQTIPITLQPLPAPTTLRALEINQLIAVICQYVAGSISLDVAFFTSGATNPATFGSIVFLNTTTQQWYIWDTSTGAYTIITQYRPTDVKFTYASGDELAAGWVVLDGRLLNTLTGLSTAQMAVLSGLFGTGATTRLPTVNPAVSFPAFPTAASVAAIPFTATAPADNVIGGLPIGAAYDQAEVEALRDNTEILRDSTAATNDDAVTLRDAVAATLTALNAGSVPSPALYAKIYVGAA